MTQSDSANIEATAHTPRTLRFLKRIYDPRFRRHAFAGHDPTDVEAWGGAGRAELREMLGLSAIERSVPASFEPHVAFSDDPERVEGYTRHKGVLHSEPDVEIPFWMLRPDGAGAFPLGIFPHGHSHFGMNQYVGLYEDEAGRQRIETEHRDVAVQAVRRGLVAIAPTTRGFRPADIPDLGGRHGQSSCRSQLMHALLAGRTAVGERVWDMMRFIDWAETQPEIDARRVLMMGNSGGGVVTTYAAACDPRVSVAVPSCSFCTFVGEDGRIHSCDCNIVPGVMRFGESSDVAGLVAPRALCIVNGRKDPLFPVPEVEKAAEKVRAIYEAAGCPDRFAHRFGDEGHRFYKRLTWPFIEKHLPCP